MQTTTRPGSKAAGLGPTSVALAVVTAATWAGWLVLGQGPGDYAVWRVAGLVLTLAVAVAVVAWRGPVAAVAVVPPVLAAAAFVDWSRSDDSGLFVVGVGLVLVGSTAAVLVAAALVHVLAAARARRP